MEALSPETLRMIERMIIAIGGIISIVLGYRLFRLVPTDNVSGGALKSAVINITLSKVGPGVFFAAFGAFILMYGVTTQITDRSDVTPQAASLDFLRPFSDLFVARIEKVKDEDDKKDLKSILAAINQVIATGSPSPRSTHVSTFSYNPTEQFSR
jgi:hypothetical protein